MKVLVVLACVAIVVARPEPPVGGYHQHHQHHGGHGGHGGYNYAQPAQYQPAPAPAVFGQSSQFSGSAATASAGASYFDTLSAGGASGSFSGASANSFSNSQVNTASFAAPQQQIVQKHIYVHVPPPEPEHSFQQQIVGQGLRQKHYKIIFIKTPHVQPSAAQLALQQSQNEEKTIVYVLVKKPDALGDISLPAPPVTKPSKPEVYFIKYKTNTEEVQAPIGLGVSSSGSAQADAGLGLLSSSGVASSSAVAGAVSSVSTVSLFMGEISFLFLHRSERLTHSVGNG
uniref:DM5 domain-containing protein n=1 Tax=Anopheles maculatus TaxID=74869 RepID=A0A182T6Q0_9DIPT